METIYNHPLEKDLEQVLTDAVQSALGISQLQKDYPNADNEVLTGHFVQNILSTACMANGLIKPKDIPGGFDVAEHTINSFPDAINIAVTAHRAMKHFPDDAAAIKKAISGRESDGAASSLLNTLKSGILAESYNRRDAETAAATRQANIDASMKKASNKTQAEREALQNGSEDAKRNLAGFSR